MIFSDKKYFNRIIRFAFPEKLILEIIIYFVLSGFTVPNHYAQTVNGADYFIRNWNLNDGLPNNRVNSVIQSETGYLWLGTSSGLVRFDGVKFKVYDSGNTNELTNDNIQDVFEDSQNRLWIGTEGGGLFYSYNGKWTAVNTDNGLSNDFVNCITEDFSGNIWVGTNYGLNKISSNGITIYGTADGLYDNIITALKIDFNGILWVGTLRGGVSQFGSNVIYTYGYNEGLKEQSVFSLETNNLGELLVGTMRGIYKLNPQTRKINQVYNLRYTPITDMSFDKNNTLWITTMADGIKSYSKGQFNQFSQQEAFYDDYTKSLYIDELNNAWCGTDIAGLIKAQKNIIANLLTNNGLPQDVITSILEDNNGGIWVGTRKSGIYRSNSINEPFEYFSLIPTLNDQINFIYQSDNLGLWIGNTLNGIKIFEKNKVYNISSQDGLSSNYVISALEDNGSMWIGTNIGLNLIKDKKVSRSYLDGEQINLIFKNKNDDLLIGTKNSLFRLGNDSTFNELFTGYDLISFFEGTDSTLFFGTKGKGLLYWNYKKVLPITTENGLADNNVNSITKTDSINYWISTAKGIQRLELDTLKKIDESENLYFSGYWLNEIDGMKSQICSMGQSVVLYLQNQILIYPTSAGLSLLNINELPEQSDVQNLIIEEISLDDKDVELTNYIEVPNTVKEISIRFTAINFTSPEKLVFRYKLTGKDKHFQYIQPLEDRVVNIKNPGAGNFNFILQAALFKNDWENNSLTIGLNIQSPFYTKPWFLILISVIMFSIYGGNLILTKRKKALEKENKYKTINIDPEKEIDVIKKLNVLIADDKVYLNPNLSLRDLAKKLNIHPNYLSRIINEKYGLSFNDYINKKRIEEVKLRFKDPKHSNKNITEIMYTCGFYSKSVFNTAFKKFTGKTPSEYRKGNM